MNNTFEDDFFWISQGAGKVTIGLHLTGEADKSVRIACQIFSGFILPKIIKIG